MRDAPWAPFTIDFNLANIGGPSAGLMFSLAVIDKLTTGDLNGGKFVAGTGTISPDGKVGSIGGITHKMSTAQEAGATVFLVPADNCDEARTVRRQLHGAAQGRDSAPDRRLPQGLDLGRQPADVLADRRAADCVDAQDRGVAVSDAPPGPDARSDPPQPHPGRSSPSPWWRCC